MTIRLIVVVILITFFHYMLLHLGQFFLQLTNSSLLLLNHLPLLAHLHFL